MNAQALRIALYQPDIAPNTGAAMRLCACLGVGLDVIEPCGFVWDDRKLDRTAMDYRDLCDLKRHNDWESFLAAQSGRIVLLTSKGDVDATAFEFLPGDIILAGRESAGVPDEVHKTVHARIRIPMQGAARSMNVINALSFITGVIARQFHEKAPAP